MTPSSDDAALFDRDMAELAGRNPGRAWLALAVLAALALIATSAWRQGWFTPTASLYIELPGASGVQIGTPVKLKGFKIGEVDALELEPDLNVKARLRIETRRMPLLGADTVAHFGRDGPIGGKYIDISPGTPGALRLAEGKTLPMEVGSELDDVMATVKVALEKLTVAIGKVDPILDDTKKLTGEASSASASVRQSMGAVLDNLEAISRQLKQVGATASRVAANADQDRAALVADVRKTLAAATQATESAGATLKTVEAALPALLDKVQRSASDANAITADARHIAAEAKTQLPPSLRAGRSVAQDAAELSAGAKRSWPLSALVGPPGNPVLGLDAWEGEKP
ncbi:MAG: hypothetical protein RLZZ401_1281 [Pseudomonadota bacterium]|jgi:phospholipid/cholesterol/gamma-HCH transport system substrate-binding protein